MIIRFSFKYREIPIDIEIGSLDEDLDVTAFAALIDKARGFINKVLEK